MDSRLHELVARYDIQTIEDKKNAVKEITQEIVLVGLAKAGFFTKAAFHGGTALRIFHGLDRFSEDLDFSLIDPDENFDFAAYLPSIKDIARQYGLDVEAKAKEKVTATNIKSAFVKGNAIERLTLFISSNDADCLDHDEKIKIRLEADTMPPGLATYETRYRLVPEPFSIKVFDKASLFSGKLHAVICRNWRTRVKGRDLYDYVFYLRQNTRFNLKHLQARLIASGVLTQEQELDLQTVKRLLNDRFSVIDYKAAKKDVEPFIKDKEVLDIWSRDFFVSITEELDCL